MTECPWVEIEHAALNPYVASQTAHLPEHIAAAAWKIDPLGTERKPSPYRTSLVQKGQLNRCEGGRVRNRPIRPTSRLLPGW